MIPTLESLLTAGRLEIGRRPGQPRVTVRPLLALGEVEALMAVCAAELDRHHDCDVGIRNSFEAAKELDAALQQQHAACDSLAATLKLVERDRDLGWVEEEAA